MLEAFENPTLNPDARKRLGVSVLTSAILYGGIGLAVVGTTAAVGNAAMDADELIQVEFASEPEAPPPPPPPAAAAAAPAPPRRRLVAPVKLSEGPLRESDAVLPDAEAGPGEEEEAAPTEVEAPVAPTVAPAPVPAAPAPRPRPAPPAGPIQLPEDATAPIPAPGNRAPAYPEAARASGVQAVVIAKIVITASGAVGAIEILRGNPAFDDAVRAALRTWRFTPAMVEGRPTAIYRIVRIPFRLDNM